MNKVLPQHCNARPYTSIRTKDAITSFEWTTVPHSPYFPDLAPSDYHLFGTMKDALRDKYYGNDEEMKIAVKNWLRKQAPEFYKLEYMPSFEGGTQLLNAMLTMLKNSSINL